MSISSYSKIYTLGHKALNDLFKNEVEITEKIDGSQISFGLFNGELRIRSKGAKINIDAPDKMFSKGVDVIKNIQPILVDGWTYRGEYLRALKHNTLEYGRTPANHIILFDIDTGLESYLPWSEVRSEALTLGLEVVPLFFKGYVNNYKELLTMLDQESILGKQKIEGIVIKNYKRFGPDGKTLMGKYVSEAFKEVHQADWKERNPGGKDILRILGQEYQSEARWDKTIFALRDMGCLKNDPSDIGLIIKNIQTDIESECIEDIKDALYKWARPKLLRQFTGGLPEYYKEKLLKSQFSEKE